MLSCKPLVPVVFITVSLGSLPLEKLCEVPELKWKKKAGLGGFTSGSLPHYLNRLHLKKEKVIQVELGQLCSDLRHIYLSIISRCF